MEEKKKLVYIAHPIAGNVHVNLNKIQNIYAEITDKYPDVVPFAPYWITFHALDDSNAGDRKIGMEQNKYFFDNRIIDEVWVYGGISEGVKREIEWASENVIKVVFKF
ncbi:MAG: hypothetical protein QXI16_04580 [Sulfolobaceae archaeon]